MNRTTMSGPTIKWAIIPLLLACLAATVRPVADPRRGAEPIVWGNYIWDESPSKPPTLTGRHFLSSNQLFVDRHSRGVTNRTGTYTFEPREGARQFIWIPNSLGVGKFEVGGFPWQLDPEAHTPWQSITLSNRLGRLYFTSQQNTGGYNLIVK
jgi:hypothetical protein